MMLLWTCTTCECCTIHIVTDTPADQKDSSPHLPAKSTGDRMTLTDSDSIPSLVPVGLPRSSSSGTIRPVDQPHHRQPSPPTHSPSFDATFEEFVRKTPFETEDYVDWLASADSIRAARREDQAKHEWMLVSTEYHRRQSLHANSSCPGVTVRQPTGGTKKAAVVGYDVFESPRPLYFGTIRAVFGYVPTTHPGEYVHLSKAASQRNLRAAAVAWIAERARVRRECRVAERNRRPRLYQVLPPEDAARVTKFHDDKAHVAALGRAAAALANERSRTPTKSQHTRPRRS